MQTQLSRTFGDRKCECETLRLVAKGVSERYVYQAMDSQSILREIHPRTRWLLHSRSAHWIELKKERVRQTDKRGKTKIWRSRAIERTQAPYMALNWAQIFLLSLFNIASLSYTNSPHIIRFSALHNKYYSLRYIMMLQNFVHIKFSTLSNGLRRFMSLVRI